MACKNNPSIVCSCTANCDKHGKCCECVANHAGKGQFPACFYSAEAERTYDRSFAMLAKDRAK